MNIKENRNFNFKIPSLPYDLRKTIWGSVDASLTIAGTVGVWFVGFIIAIVVFYLNNSSGQEVLSTYLINTQTILTSAVSIICIAAIMFSAEFGANGWPIWRRIFISNLIVLLTLMYISTMDKTEVRESVNKLEFVSTDVKDCKYSVRMSSKTLKYNFCTDDSSDYEKISEAQTANIILVSNSKSESRADHYEYVELVKLAK